MHAPHRKILLLFSGGADSALLAVRLAGIQAMDPGVYAEAVMFDYGQVHKDELSIGRKWLAKRVPRMPVVTVNLTEFFRHSRAPLLGNGESYEGVHSMYLPQRNLGFVAAAATMAESGGYGEIWYGADYSDLVNRFPDCTQDWVVKMNEVLGTGPRPIALKAPLLGMTKEDVIEELKTYNVFLADLHSGYAKPSGGKA